MSNNTALSAASASTSNLTTFSSAINSSALPAISNSSFANSSLPSTVSELDNLSIFRVLSNKTSGKSRDGQTPKRRGPKPDSKPALTRRQELNRQAQRTHRERKELYIKTLEQEILRFKDLIPQIMRERDYYRQEALLAKQLLLAHNIPFSSASPLPQLSTNINSASSLATVNSPATTITTPSTIYPQKSCFDDSSSNHATNFIPALPPPPPPPPPPPHDPPAQFFHHHHRQQQQQHLVQSHLHQPLPPLPPPLSISQSIQPYTQSQSSLLSLPVHSASTPLSPLDYDQIGIDFVLALEQPCMDHMQYLLTKSQQSDEISGHVLMATCPGQSVLLSPSHTSPSTPSTSSNSHVHTSVHLHQDTTANPNSIGNTKTAVTTHINSTTATGGSISVSTNNSRGIGTGTNISVSGRSNPTSPPPPSQPFLPFKMPDLPVPDLVKLLDLSRLLPLNGEITPVMAWSAIRSHPRFGQFTMEHITFLKEDLRSKVRCYGFGAVLEEFQVRDAIHATLALPIHASTNSSSPGTLNNQSSTVFIHPPAAPPSNYNSFYPPSATFTPSSNPSVTILSPNIKISNLPSTPSPQLLLSG